MKNVALSIVDQTALARALQEPLKLLDLKINYVQDQLFPSTANRKFLPLHAAIRGIAIKEATKAIGRVIFETPIDLAKGDRLFASDGREYSVTAAIKASQEATVESIVGGLAQNLAEGETLTLFSPVGFISSGTVGPGGLIGGSEAEELESLRQRVLDRWRSKAEYGSTDNYYAWLKETALIKAGVFPNYPVPGYVSWTGILAGAGGSFSLPSAEVEEAIMNILNRKRPPGARVRYMRESQITLINLTIKSQSPIPPQAQAVLTTNLRELFTNRAFAFGAANFEEDLPVSENTVRLNIFQVLGDSNGFELSIQPAGKLDSAGLAFGEFFLLGSVIFT